MPYQPYNDLGATGAAVRSFVVTPHNTNELPAVIRGLIIGSAGTVRWIGVDGSDNVTAALPAGFLLPIAAVRIMATGTTAGALTGLV